MRYDTQTGGIRRKLLILTIILSASLLFTLLLINARTVSDEIAAGNNFTKALIDQDIEGSYDMLADEFKTTLTIEEWEQWVSIAFDGHQTKTVELFSISIIENLGNVYTSDQMPTRLTYEFKLGNETYTMPVILVLDADGAWKVSEIGRLE